MEFRIYYFTNLYKETVGFYKTQLGLEEFRHWDRGHLDKGTIFRSPNGMGYIEIEEGVASPTIQAGLYLEVENVEAWYQVVLDNNIKVLQSLADTSYGHRSFKIEDPAGLEIGFFKYLQRP